MIEGPQWGMRYIRDEDQVDRQRIKPGTVRRILPYARPYRWAIAVLLLITVIDAVITVVNPLLLGLIIDHGILRHRLDVVVGLSLAIAPGCQRDIAALAGVVHATRARTRR